MNINANYLSPRVIETARKEFAKHERLLLKQFAMAKLPKLTTSFVPGEHFYKHGKVTVAPALTHYIEHVTNATLARVEALQFERGNYTILHDDKAQDVIEAILFVTPWNDHFGGRVVYRTEHDAHIIVPQQHALSLYRTHHKKRFIQYVNHYAGKHKLGMIIFTLHKNKR
jgi:hypothetical protein